MSRYPRAFTHKTNMFRDSWGYGDYRQYVVKLPDGATRCARYSGLPRLVATTGACAISFAIFFTGTGVALGVEIAWFRVAGLLWIGAALIAGPMSMWLRGIELVRFVGPVNNGGDSGQDRVFPWDDQAETVDG